uniref:RNase H type-1 domain-containing protein n=1 Tax=Cannabis sativa TaxID=3483 RepID=A0A803P9X2_CANSA
MENWCSFANSIWFGGSKPIRIGDILGDSLSGVLENLVLHFSNLSYGGNRVEVINYLGCVLSAIWHQRNELFINNVPVNPLVALARVEKEFLELQKASHFSRGDQIIETQPNSGSVVGEEAFLSTNSLARHILFTDASWVGGETGIAAISVDIAAGNWFVKSQRLQAQSALEGEFRAIFLAMSWAIDQGWREAIILSD